MADAARSAHGSFADIKNGAREMGQGVSAAAQSTEYSMMEARHGVMLLGEEFGVHLPRGITSFITSLGPVGAAMEAAFPYLAIIVGATLLLEHLVKIGEAAEKLAAAQDGVALATDKAFGSMGDKILAAGAQLDELRGNHLAALKKELELVDHASLKDLGGEFEHLSGAVDALFKQLGHGFLSSFLTDVEGVQHAADQFKAQYLQDIATGNGKGASDLLAGTLKSAQDALKGMLATGQTAEMSKTVQAQQQFIGMLETQVALQGQANTLAREQKEIKIEHEGNREEADAQKQQAIADKLESDFLKRNEAHRKAVEAANKKEVDGVEKLAEEQMRATDAVNKELMTAAKERAHIGEELAKEDADHIRKMSVLELAASSEQTKEAVKLKRSRDEQILAEQLRAEAAEYAAQMRAYQLELGALDVYGRDYEVKLRKLQNREIELTRAHENNVTKIKTQAEQERNARILAAQYKFNDEIARGLASVITRHETFARMIKGVGDQVAQGMLENAFKSILAMDMTKPHEAAAAARKGWLAGMDFPFPTDLVMAPLLAATGFTSVMAFETGGQVPGVEPMPILAHGGETVVTRALTEKVEAAEGRGRGGRGGTTVHNWNLGNVTDADSFKSSQTQIQNKQVHAQEVARRRNG